MDPISHSQKESFILVSLMTETSLALLINQLIIIIIIMALRYVYIIYRCRKDLSISISISTGLLD